MPEITLNDPFGKAMYNTILDYKIYSILEIGAFDGDGSTIVLSEALARKKAEVSLISLEYTPERFTNLKANASKFPFVKPIQASSIGRHSFSAWDFEVDVWDTPYNGLQYPKEQVRDWHLRDIALMSHTEAGYLDSVPTKGPWDAVLIDGGEFTGYDEFNLVRNRTRCLFLDDAFSAFKTNRIRRELSSSKDWKLIWDGPHVRNGGSIFVHKDLQKANLIDRFMLRFT
jgi:hypothetical protein